MVNDKMTLYLLDGATVAVILLNNFFLNPLCLRECLIATYINKLVIYYSVFKILKRTFPNLLPVP